MKYICREPDEASWDAYLLGHKEANFLQSWQWLEAHKLAGYKIKRFVFCDENNQIIGITHGVIKDARRGRYFEVSGGPIFDWQDKKLGEFIFSTIEDYAKQNKCVFIRIRPQLIDSADNRNILKNYKFKIAPMHLYAEHTSIINLEKSEDELLKGMRRQTRYEVRRAAKDNIKVTSSSDVKELDEFYSVQLDTAKRQGFVPSEKSFLLALMKNFKDKIRIYKATVNDKLLCLGFVIFYGTEADYYEAASTVEGRNYPGAYALQWQIIKDAKALNKTRYNLWGIAYNNNPKHRYAGVTTFKNGFGGKTTVFVPAHDYILNKPRYLFDYLIETARKKTRRL